MTDELAAFVLGAILAIAMMASGVWPQRQVLPTYYDNPQSQGNDDGHILETTTDA